MSIQCQLDTGATCNVMIWNDLCEIKQHGNLSMEPTTVKLKLKLYDGTIISVIGEVTLRCKSKEKQLDINFKIIPGKQKPLLSGNTCLRMGFITINNVHTVEAKITDNLLNEYQDVFKGLGCQQGEYHIDINQALTPV